ncbi:hypothetical protein ASF48_04905 [Rathayibacter sp. Leaf299]|uniref:hypothetical protein n=1 Tax=unclassified Rathayibacter TaxID=2609250 RepID=UPI0006F94ACC|nr:MULTISPECIES: hypothetical protein [unclassified Rathayibacter]KQQ22525.1 hypothetical protein ASF48_04905 [Rathayibacter sp. Leaf299]
MVTYTGFTQGDRVTRINEREMARMFFAAGDTGHVLTRQSFVLTALGGNRRLQLSAGGLSACGVIVQREGVADSVTIDVPTPASGRGQWFLGVARFNWSARTVTYPLIASETTGQFTADKMPERPPLRFPTLNREAGLLFDVPLGWVWASYAFTAMRTISLTVMADGFPTDLFAWDGNLDATRTNPDNVAPGGTGEYVGFKRDFQARGLYAISANGVAGTAEVNTASTGETVLVVNGTDVEKVRSDHIYSARPTHLTAYVDHPGGVLSVSLQFRGGSGTVSLLASSQVRARWIRGVSAPGALA